MNKIIDFPPLLLYFVKKKYPKISFLEHQRLVGGQEAALDLAKEKGEQYKSSDGMMPLFS